MFSSKLDVIMAKLESHISNAAIAELESRLTAQKPSWPPGRIRRRHLAARTLGSSVLKEELKGKYTKAKNYLKFNSGVTLISK